MEKKWEMNRIVEGLLRKIGEVWSQDLFEHWPKEDAFVVARAYFSFFVIDFQRKEGPEK